MVCGNSVMKFKEGTTEMTVLETGKGGLARMVEALKANCESEIGLGIFRVTAVDDRGVTVSYRTKLIHVTYVGPKIPVMKKAKAASFNSSFRSGPFVGIAQFIQTDDLDSEVTETNIEKLLRASGGAHQPTSFDFNNSKR